MLDVIVRKILEEVEIKIVNVLTAGKLDIFYVIVINLVEEKTFLGLVECRGVHGMGLSVVLTVELVGILVGVSFDFFRVK